MATAAQIRAGHRRSIRKMKTQLVEMAGRWDEVDNYVIGRIDDLIANFDGLETAMDEAVAYERETKENDDA